LLVLWLLHGGIAMPQEVSSSGTQQQLPVYIVDFKQELRPELLREFGDFSAFTTGLIQLRLFEIPSVTVHRVQAAPICGSEQPSTNQSPQIVRAPVTPSGDFYTVQGLIETQLPNVILNYSVQKCEGQQLRTVFQEAQPFTLDHALDEITIAAHAIAFKIERAIPPTPVDVTLFETDSGLPDQKNIVSGVQKAVVQEITKSSDYNVTDSSEYKIVGHITFQKPRLTHLLGGIALTAEMHVESHGKSYPLKSISGTNDQLPKFYSAISEEVMRGLPEVLLAEHLQLRGFIENMKADELYSQANQLLEQCRTTEGECAGAQDAITLLKAASEQDPKSWRILLLLGKVQTQIGKAADAILSLNKAQTLIKQELSEGHVVSVTDQASVLNQLGDSYESMIQYEKALQAYDESLRLDPTQAAIYRNKAQLYQYQGKPLVTMAFLIEGLKKIGKNGETQPLHKSLEDVVLSLQDAGDIGTAGKTLVDAVHDGVPVTNECALLISRWWSRILDVDSSDATVAKAKDAMKTLLELPLDDPDILAGVYAMSARVELNANSQQLQDFVAKVNQLPANQVSAANREWAQRILAQDYINHAEYEKAAEAADTAYHLLATDRALYMIANSNLLSARCKERAWRLGKEPGGMELCKSSTLLLDEPAEHDSKLTRSQQDELRKMYQDVASHAAPLVAKRFIDGDFILMRANHSLDEDSQTRDQFQHLVQQDPKDQSALNTLMYVCSQYLFDYSCAFSAARTSTNSLSKTGRTAASDYLNIAEVAVLQREDKTAMDWLGVALSQPDPQPQIVALIYLYRLWAAMHEGQTAEFKSDFDSWLEATNRHRAGKDVLDWTFRGARIALHNPRNGMSENRIKLLSSMMDALDDSNATLPVWPESGSL